MHYLISLIYTYVHVYFFLCDCMHDVHLCMGKGQWEWWVCKRVTASSLYITSPSSPLAPSRNSVEIPAQIFWSVLHKEPTPLNSYWQLKDNHTAASKKLFISGPFGFVCFFFNALQGFQGHGNCCAETGWQVGGLVDVQVEPDRCSVGSDSCQTWGLTETLIYPNLCWSKTFGKLWITFGRVSSRSNPAVDFVNLKLWGVKMSLHGHFQSGYDFSLLDTTYLLLSVGFYLR